MADLRFGSFLAPSLLPTYEAIATAVGTRLGVSIEMVVEDDYQNCINDVNDLCFVCSLPYVIFDRQGLSPAVPVAAPILIGSRYGGRPIYFSDVIVQRGNPASSFLDLRGSSWGYNEPMSQSGYGITRYHLVSIGETDGFFGEVVETGFHHRSIELVRRGELDASAIDSHVLEVAIDADPSLVDDIKVVDVLGPSTIQPIAISRRIPPELAGAILEVLTEMHTEPSIRAALDRGRIERITPISSDAYLDIRQMLEVCEEAGFLELR